MLTADQFDALVEPIVELFNELQTTVIADIARRLAGLDFASPTAAWQMQRLSEAGALYDDILKELSRLTGKSEATLRRIFQQAGVKALKFDDSVYRAAGLNPLPLNLSPAMAQTLAAGLRKTQGAVRNLTMTTALSGQDAFIRAADQAYLQITTGTFSYQDALKQAVRDVSEEGLTVISFPRRAEQLDVAMRRTVLTGVGQTTAELSLSRAAEMNQDLVQMSAHGGARPEHAEWQGQVFSRSGAHPKFPPFVESTGYGTVTGFAGVNCRHSAFPFFEGLSQNAYDRATLDEMADKTVEYNGRELSHYQATQQQRYIERKIRYWKRHAAAFEAAGLPADRELAKVRDWQARMRDFIRQTSLQRDRFREQVFE